MRRCLLFLFAVLSLQFTIAQTSAYSGTGGLESRYRDKYKLTAKIDEAAGTLKLETNAPVQKVILSVYTPQELSVRKGTDNTKTFAQWPGSYTYDLKTASYKDKYAYWIKVYGADGLISEYFFRKKETPVTVAKPVEEAKRPAPAESAPSGEEVKTADGGTVIKTSINCREGSAKVDKALREMEGVFDVSIDIATGKLTLHYSSDGSPFVAILQTIRDNGFDADGQKATKPAENPCQVKTKRN